MNWIRRHLTYANVMVTILAFIVLGGGTALASYVVSSNSQVGPNTISGHKPPAGDHANIINGSINGMDLSASAVGTPQLKAGAVKSPELGTGAVTNNKLGFESVTNQKIGNQAIDDRTIHAGAVSNADLGDGAVSSAKIGFIPQARVEFTGAQTIANATNVALSFDVATYDNDGFFGIPHNRLTAPVDGVYAITANVTWEPNTSGDRYMAICKNDSGATCPGATTLAENSGVGATAALSDAWQTVSTQAKLSAGDYIDVGVVQNSGGTMHVEAGPTTNLTMSWIGNG